MKIKLDFSELASTLGYVNTVLSDKTVDEKMKNVIFLVSKDEVSIVGYSPLTFSRTKLSNIETIDVEDNWDFQVKASELNKIISSYSSLYKTKVNEVELEEYKNKIRIIIHEEAIKEEDERLAQTGKFLLDNVPILKSVSNEIHMEFPKETDSIFSSELLLYIDSLYPLMVNDSSSSISSKLNFSDKYVFIMSSYLTTVFENKLPESFKNLTLGYSSVNFLKRLCDGVESIDVQRIDNYLCIESGSTEAFLKYKRVKVNVSQYVARKNKDNGIMLDRLYLKDVLKRMLVSSQDGIVKMNELGLEVSNEGFSQIIPLNNKKGDVDNLKFKISIPVLIKTIVGDDSVFPQELFVYFVKTGSSGYVLYIQDNSGAWFSTIQVRV